MEDRDNIATNAVRFLAKAGVIIMPLDPTPEMTLAASRVCNVTMEQAEKIYEAMIRSAYR